MEKEFLFYDQGDRVLNVFQNVHRNRLFNQPWYLKMYYVYLIILVPPILMLLPICFFETSFKMKLLVIICSLIWYTITLFFLVKKSDKLKSTSRESLLLNENIKEKLTEKEFLARSFHQSLVDENFLDETKHDILRLNNMIIQLEEISNKSIKPTFFLGGAFLLFSHSIWDNFVDNLVIKNTEYDILIYVLLFGILYLLFYFLFLGNTIVNSVYDYIYRRAKRAKYAAELLLFIRRNLEIKYQISNDPEVNSKENVNVFNWIYSFLKNIFSR